MKFEKFIIKERIHPEYQHVIGILEKDCSDILDVMKKTHNALWRGVINPTSDFIKEIIPRTDRRPRDTKQWLHEKIDDAFYKKFGWRVRSEGVFATASSAAADEFGRPYLFFPFNGYRFVWSDDVVDITEHFSKFNYPIDPKVNNTLVKRFAGKEYSEIIEPDKKTGAGRGKWVVYSYGRGENLQFKNFDEIEKHYGKIKVLATVRNYDEADFKIAFTHEGLYGGMRVHAYWVENLSDSDNDKIAKITKMKVEDAVDNELDEILSKSYKDSRIEHAVYSMNEISFKCRKYYIVNSDFWYGGFSEYIGRGSSRPE